MVERPDNSVIASLMRIVEIEPNRKAGRPITHAMKIAGLYLLFAIAWIVISDYLAQGTILDGDAGSDSYLWMQTVKGCAFVLVTGALLLWYTHRQFARQHRMNEAIAEHRRMFSTLVYNLPGMPYRCFNDSRWTMDFVGPGCEQLTGYPARALREGQVDYENIIHPDDRQRVRNTVDDAIADRLPFQVEYRIIAADGETRDVYEYGQGVYDDDGPLVAIEGFIHDVTEQRRARRLESEHRAMLTANRAMEQSLGVVGHELRTPLASLRAMSEYLIDTSENLPKQHREFLQSIHDETVRLTHMATQMLDAARLAVGARRWNWSSFNLQDTAEVAAHIIRALIKDRPIRFGLSVMNEKLTMKGDSDAIQRLMINLLSNSMRHTERGHVDLTIDQVYHDEQRMIRFCVNDTGQGISPESRKQLGIAFAAQSGAPDLANKRGAGLGLAICRQIVSAHGGKMQVHSKEGEGTTFIVTVGADLDAPTDAGPCEIEFIEDEETETDS